MCFVFYLTEKYTKITELFRNRWRFTGKFVSRRHKQMSMFMCCLEILNVCRLISGLYCDIFLDYNLFYWVRIRSNVDLDLHGLYFIVKIVGLITSFCVMVSQSSTSSSMMWLFNCVTQLRLCYFVEKYVDVQCANILLVFGDNVHLDGYLLTLTH